jgi:hypothetical protein
MFKLGCREDTGIRFVDYEGGRPLEFDTREHAQNYLRFLITCLKGDFDCLEVIEVDKREAQ